MDFPQYAEVEWLQFDTDPDVPRFLENDDHSCTPWSRLSHFGDDACPLHFLQLLCNLGSQGEGYVACGEEGERFGARFQLDPLKTLGNFLSQVSEGGFSQESILAARCRVVIAGRPGRLVLMLLTT